MSLSAALPENPLSTGVAIVLVAAGRGLRAGGEIPKQYVSIAGKSLLAHTIEALAVLSAPIQTVIGAGDLDLYGQVKQSLSARARALLREPVSGGATRQASVRAGLDALSSNPPAVVLIHDGARCTPGAALLQRAVAEAHRHGAAIPALKATDTIKQVDAQERTIATLARDSLRMIQTPQAFAYALIHEAHAAAARAGLIDFPDDAAVAEWAGHPVICFEGDPKNMKVTTSDDFALAAARLMAACADIRTGQGYDVHAFGPGDHVWLGGVKIPHDHALVGHSDADVLMHAITDAILGALADADIGSHFPPSDPQWKGASTDIFLRHAVGLVAARGGMIAHLDGTVICEAPKVGPHRDAIRARLAEICGLALDRVAVKATTSERLGFTGRGEGIAAMAMATIRLPLGGA
ncbi:MAG: 2C-methyl-D-erythritol 2,4-cyclodiphosphate synthase [Hyphomicrobiales bacterium]|nr:2C-methyl-D-erythritol 2,4-cyclodiphosphate synthase [Hyphomicrobiales bacterium]